MGKINTAERVSREMSDNFVFQRSLLAYHAAAQRIGGERVTASRWWLPMHGVSSR